MKELPPFFYGHIHPFVSSGNTLFERPRKRQTWCPFWPGNTPPPSPADKDSPPIKGSTKISSIFQFRFQEIQALAIFPRLSKRAWWLQCFIASSSVLLHNLITVVESYCLSSCNIYCILQDNCLPSEGFNSNFIFLSSCSWFGGVLYPTRPREGVILYFFPAPPLSILFVFSPSGPGESQCANKDPRQSIFELQSSVPLDHQISPWHLLILSSLYEFILG